MTTPYHGQGHVSSLPPGPGDVLVVTTIGGRAVTFHTIDQFDEACRLARGAILGTSGHGALTVKVLSLTLREAQALGLVPASLFGALSPAQEAALRQSVVSTLHQTLRDCDDREVRRQAHELLQQMGERS